MSRPSEILAQDFRAAEKELARYLAEIALLPYAQMREKMKHAEVVAVRVDKLKERWLKAEESERMVNWFPTAVPSKNV